MRIGIISDIHGNIDAFRAVLAEFNRRQVDKYIYLGDLIGMGLHPEECVQLVMQLKDKFLGIVHGNHENYLFYGLPLHNHSDPNREVIPQETIDYFKWNHGLLSPESVAFLKSLPDEQTIETDGAKIFLTHYPIAEGRKYRKFYYTPSLAECEEIFAGFDADVYLFGHTHCMDEQHSDKKHYINPGCTGCPSEVDAAPAGILDINNGQINYEHINVAYDTNKVVDELRAIIPQYPFAEYVIQDFYRKVL